MRVGKGPETIVPEQRIVSLEKNHGEDVIIAQYVITKPHESYQLEVRQLELYLGALYEWTDEQKGYGLDMIGNIFLGGGESRCIPWTRCNVPYFCCGCDEKSFVSNSPILVRAPDGSSRCPVHPASLKLPLCPNLDSSRPGRWLNTEYPPTPSEKGCLKPYHSIITSPSDMKDLLSKGLIQNNTVRFPEISGDPCTVASAHPEEWGQSFWVYAPYTCRYNIYTRSELHQCLADQNISHIHIQGDSMSRDLFSAVASYLGVKMIEQDELKKMTNVLKEKRLMFNTGEVIVTLGYSWDYEEDVMKLAIQPPLPQVFITNHALTHRAYDNHTDTLRRFHESEYRFWKTELGKGTSLPLFRFYVDARGMHGKREERFQGNKMRRNSAMIRDVFSKELGFSVVHEYILMEG
eukprot:gene2183-2609_t